MRKGLRWLFGSIAGTVILFVVGLPGLLEDVATWADWIDWIDGDLARWAFTLVALGVIAVLARRRGESSSAPKPKLPKSHRHTGNPDQVEHTIGPGWFVSFTSGIFKTPREPGGHYATAIGEVVTRDADRVEVQWRDRVDLPTHLPIELLVVPQVVRIRDGTRMTASNSGLQIVNGAIHISSGWHAHRSTPAGVARLRVGDLNEAQRAEFEADGDLSTWIVTN